MSFREWKTIIPLEAKIVSKFVTNTNFDVRNNYIIHAEMKMGYDDWGDEEPYYRVITMDKAGNIHKYISESTYSKKWYEIR